MRLTHISNEFNKIKNNYEKFIYDFQIKNLAMSIKAASLCGLKDELIFNSIKKITDVDGRLELVKSYANGIKVFIDYAHTPDALLKTLSALKSKFQNNISLIFGCGGERDKKKRPLMAKIADNNSKKIYVTDDNPRNENPKNIRKELLKHIKKAKLLILEIGR